MCKDNGCGGPQKDENGKGKCCRAADKAFDKNQMPTHEKPAEDAPKTGCGCDHGGKPRPA